MKRAPIISLSLSLALASCAQSHAVRFPPRAFTTRPNQRVVITTSRGRTEVRSVAGSRDIMVGGTILTSAPSAASADAAAQAVRVTDTIIPAIGEPVLVLEVAGIPPSSSTFFDSEFLVPADLRLTIRDGPEDLRVEGLKGGVTIRDGPGDITLERVDGPVDIEDLDGDIIIYRGKGPLKVKDRRGGILIEEVTGLIDIADHEDEIQIESVTGDVVLGKHNRGMVRINNLDGHVVIREWMNNNTQPVINTIWEPPAAAGTDRETDGATPGAPAPAAARIGGTPPSPKDAR